MRVVGYDPLANEMARNELTDKAVILEDVGSCLQQADAVVITTPDPEFCALQQTDFPKKIPPLVVYDCWRILREKLESSPHVRYIPLGVGIVIPPWNFPMAILCGMTSAALVTGNTVILKPSSDSPKIGQLFMEILEEAGLPEGVVNFVTGSGSVVGDYLVRHPKTRFISFTGSKEVGLSIVEQAAIAREGQIWIKRVVAEMGGKDAIVIDSETDLDSAAIGIVYSAFGFQGQKCSACSRAIVVEDVYDELLDKIAECTKKLTVGPTKNYVNFMGAVINEKAGLMEDLIRVQPNFPKQERFLALTSSIQQSV